MKNDKIMFWISTIAGVLGIRLGLANLMACLFKGQAWLDNAWEWAAIAPAPSVWVLAILAVFCTVIGAWGMYLGINGLEKMES